MASRKDGNKNAGSIASPSKQLLLRSVALSATLEEQQEQVLKRQKMYEAHHTKMLKIIDRLCKQDRYGHFHQPSTLKEYIENVSRPMDLGTMRKNVENHVYSKVIFLASERHKKEKVELRQLIWNIGASVYATSARDKKESKAKVLEVDRSKNRIKVHFQGWQSKFDEWLPSALVRTEQKKKNDEIRVAFF